MDRSYLAPTWIHGRLNRISIAALGLVILCLATYYPFLTARYADFRAFYCSGQAVLTHADPYREHPMRECEKAVKAPGVPAVIEEITVPSPFPGYALALFAALAVLPFAIAAGIWLGASIVALILSCVLVARLTHVSLWAVGSVIVFPSAIVALQLGQVTPFIGLAMIATATLLNAQKPRWAAVAALGIALEPHVAVPIFLTLLVGVPTLRVPLVLGTIGIGALSLAVLGIGLNIEYVRDVLPAHALANIPDLSQFSSAHFAYSFGLPLSIARTIGSVWYAVAAAIGVAAALVLRPRFGVMGLVFVPPAFALFGGLHVHYSQLALAIPAFLLLLPAAGRARAPFAAAIFCAAMPWLTIANYPMLVPALLIVAFAFAGNIQVKRIALTLALSAAILALVLFRTSFLGVPDHAPPLLNVAVVGNPLAEFSWRVAMLRRDGYSPIGWFMLAKVPTLVAFGMLLFAFCRLVWGEFSDASRPSATRLRALYARKTIVAER